MRLKKLHDELFVPNIKQAVTTMATTTDIFKLNVGNFKCCSYVWTKVRVTFMFCKLAAANVCNYVIAAGTWTRPPCDALQQLCRLCAGLCWRDHRQQIQESRVEVDNQPESRASFLPCFPQVQGRPMCSVDSCPQLSLAVSESKGDPCTDRSAAHRGITLWTVCTKPQSGDRETERWIGAGATLKPLLNHTCYNAFSFRLLLFFSCQIRSITVWSRYTGIK